MGIAANQGAPMSRVPAVIAASGLILLVVGILVGRRPRHDVEAGPSARSPELAPAESAEDADRSGSACRCWAHSALHCSCSASRARPQR